MMQELEYFASCPKQIEPLLAAELATLGCTQVRQGRAGVYFTASQQRVYKVCLWTRLASRILLPVARGAVATSKQLYSLVYGIPWEEMLPGGCRFVVDFDGTNSEIRNTQFGAQRVKDAIVDRYVRLNLTRPQVDKNAPHIRVKVRLARTDTVVAIDLVGDSLHRRGYRRRQGRAPLKENLAAALLIRAGWPSLLQESRAREEKIALADPLCGAGTLLIEGALMAANMAPGLLSTSFSFEHLINHRQALWREVRQEANEAVVVDALFPRIEGYDNDPQVLTAARENIAAAGLSDRIQVSRRALAEFKRPDEPAIRRGLLICNPPYGERLGEIKALQEDYRSLGRVAKSALENWRMAVLTGSESLGREMRLRATHKYRFYNGAMATQLLVFAIVGEQARLREDQDLQQTPLSEGAQMVFNRLVKNQKRLRKWRQKEHIECFRAYDADLPEYAAAIDVYGDHLHIQEYQAPKNVDAGRAAKRFRDIIHASVQAFNVSPDHIHAKTRKRHKGNSQYQKLSSSHAPDLQKVREGDATLWVNLTDYLDTGLFLDHRPLRRHIHKTALGKRFLNLFCYTASATVHAALGGASESFSVDLSNTYLDWAKRNFELNNIAAHRHRLVRADGVAWLQSCRQGFDIILLDPPTFSNSKNTSTVLDIQKDHAALVTRCMEVLNPGGVLYFSTNLRSFKLDAQLADNFAVRDITAATLDPDFERSQKIHYCWQIQHREN